MEKRTSLALGSIVLLSAWLPAAGLAAQAASAPQKQVLQQLIRLEQKVPAEERRLFSGTLSNWLTLAHSILDPPGEGSDGDGSRPPLTLSGVQSGTSAAFAADQIVEQSLEAEKDNGAAQVSNPGFDVRFSRLTGFTQSTSSSAWCGHNIVTGFNSTTASVITGVLPFLRDPSLFGVSLGNVGVAFSSDDGASFSDPGFLNPGPTSNKLTSMGGNPVVVCAGPEKFYYLTSPFSTFINDPVTFTGQLFAGVGLSMSTDGGRRWGAPVSVVTKDAVNLLDQAWIAIDPSDLNRLYVVYTDLDLDGVFADTVAKARCPNTVRHAIEIITSADSGRTWSAPSLVREDCDPLDSHGFIQPGPVPIGPQLAVAPDGTVLTSYMVFAPNGSVKLHFRRSRNRGRSFDAEVKVSKVVLTGDPGGAFGGILQGFFANLQVPTMAVDPVKRNGRYTIYIAWSDGRDNPQVDVLTGTYNFSDILIARSSDAGSSWSAPRPVSPMPDDFSGVGRDQFQPGVAVDSDGTVAVCYYDRRNDPQNNAIDHYCSTSSDGARSFHDIRQTAASWSPVHGTDFFLNLFYLGQYDTVAPHLAARGSEGFFSGFQIIKKAVPSVHGRSFRRGE